MADLEFEGDAHAAALDLSLADGRFAPDLLEIAARRAVAAWAEAIDGDDKRLAQIASPRPSRRCCIRPVRRSRLVVRGPKVKRIAITGLDAAAEPPTMTIEVELKGRRYLEDRATTAVLQGSAAREASFTEHWKLALERRRGPAVADRRRGRAGRRLTNADAGRRRAEPSGPTHYADGPMIPIKDNIPTDRFPVVTVVLIVLNFIAYFLAIRHGGSFISGPDTQEVMKYGAIPKALTHSNVHCAEVRQHAEPEQPGDRLQLAPAGRKRDRGGEPASAVADRVHVDVHARLDPPHRREHAVPVDLREQRRGLDGSGEVHLLLPARRDRGAGAAGGDRSELDRAHDRRLGGDRGRARRLPALYPKARVLTFIFIILFVTVIELPALVMLGIWFLEQAVFAALGLTNPTGGGGGVAYFAHVGGFAFGLLTIRLLATNVKKVPPRAPVY